MHAIAEAKDGKRAGAAALRSWAQRRYLLLHVSSESILQRLSASLLREHSSALRGVQHPWQPWDPGGMSWQLGGVPWDPGGMPWDPGGMPWDPGGML